MEMHNSWNVAYIAGKNSIHLERAQDNTLLSRDVNLPSNLDVTHGRALCIFFSKEENAHVVEQIVDGSMKVEELKFFSKDGKLVAHLANSLTPPFLTTSMRTTATKALHANPLTPPNPQLAPPVALRRQNVTKTIRTEALNSDSSLSSIRQPRKPLTANPIEKRIPPAEAARISLRVKRDFPENPTPLQLLADPNLEKILPERPPTETAGHLVFQKHTGDAKIVYTYHDEIGLMTHKRADKQQELEKEFDKSVVIRVNVAREKLNKIAEADSPGQMVSKKTTALKEKIKEVCSLYEKELKNEDGNDCVYNFSSFLKWVNKPNSNLHEDYKKEINDLIAELQDMQDRRNTHSPLVAEGIDDALKYIDVESIKIEINGRTFYKKQKSEGDLNYFFRNQINNLNELELNVLAKSFDKMIETMELIKMLHGDISPNNIYVYKGHVEQNIDGMDIQQYYMKIANFGESSLGGSMFSNMASAADGQIRQKEDMGLIELMTLTKKYKKFSKPGKKRSVLDRANRSYLAPDTIIRELTMLLENIEKGHKKEEARNSSWLKEIIAPEKLSDKEESLVHAAGFSFSETDVPTIIERQTDLEKIKDMCSTPLGMLLIYYDTVEREKNYPVTTTREEGPFFPISSEKREDITGYVKSFIRANLDSKKYEMAHTSMQIEDQDEEDNEAVTLVDAYALEIDLKVLEAYEKYSGEDMSKEIQMLKELLPVQE